MVSGLALHFFGSSPVAGRQASQPSGYSPSCPLLSMASEACGPSGDRAGRSERPVAMGPVVQLLLSPAPLGFLLQWTLGAIVCCDPKLTGKETVSLTPYPLWCLLFVGGQEVLLETSYFAVVCFCFSVLGAELRPSCKSFTAQQHP